MKVKNVIGKKVAKMVKMAAMNASNTVSIAGFHQPKEPVALKKVKK